MALWALSAAPVGAPALAAQPLPEEVADALVIDSVDERVVLRHLPREGAGAGEIRGDGPWDGRPGSNRG